MTGPEAGDVSRGGDRLARGGVRPGGGAPTSQRRPWNRERQPSLSAGPPVIASFPPGTKGPPEP